MLKFITESSELFCKYFLMISEYSFAGVLVGSVITKELPFQRWMLILFGSMSSLVFLFASIGMSRIARRNQQHQ